jgi:hypothetical protein
LVGWGFWSWPCRHRFQRSLASWDSCPVLVVPYSLSPSLLYRSLSCYMVQPFSLIGTDNIILNIVTSINLQLAHHFPFSSHSHTYRIRACQSLSHDITAREATYPSSALQPVWRRFGGRYMCYLLFGSSYIMHGSLAVWLSTLGVLVRVARLSSLPGLEAKD